MIRKLQGAVTTKFTESSLVTSPIGEFSCDKIYIIIIIIICVSWNIICFIINCPLQ